MATPTPAPEPPPHGTVITGVDALASYNAEALQSKRLGLVTNPTGRTSAGESTIDVLARDPRWRLVALFSPEHGMRGDADAGQDIASGRDAQSGLPVFSLYGETTRPTAAMLRGVDVLVYDIQDVGARVYTYTSTLLELLRGGAEHGVPVVVLDRPDPIGGDAVEGNVLDPRFASFVGPAPIAMRYGMTIGELGKLFNAELSVGADLTVVPMQGWRRSMWLDETGIGWVNPSPNLRSLTAAAAYPGTVLFEGTNLSEGRGTDSPFEWVGAPWVDGTEWASRLNSLDVPGVRFAAAAKTPDASKHAGVRCEGVAIEIMDRGALRPMELGLTMLQTARAVAPGRVQFTPSSFDRLAGTDQLRKALEAGRSASDIAVDWQPALDRFRATRARYLLY